MKRTLYPCLVIFAFCAAALYAAGVAVVAADPNAPAQIPQTNYLPRLLALFGTDPALAGLSLADPNQLPILGPVVGDPNAWDVPCGPWRRKGEWKDPEGKPVTVTRLAGDIESEVTTAPDGTWTLTVPFVSPGWHYVRVRATDEPPAGSVTVATRDVEIWFRGVPGPNAQPVLE